MNRFFNIKNVMLFGAVLIGFVFFLYVYNTRGSSLSSDPDNWHETFEFLSFLATPYLSIIATYLIFKQSQREAEEAKLSDFWKKWGEVHNKIPSFTALQLSMGMPFPAQEFSEFVKGMHELNDILVKYNLKFYRNLTSERLKILYDNSLFHFKAQGFIVNHNNQNVPATVNHIVDVALQDFLDLGQKLQ